MKIWIICQNNSLPEHGHFNRHFNFAKQLKQMGHEPTLFFGSNPHNTNTQIVNKGKSICFNNYGFDTNYVKTIVYNGSMKKRLFAMWQFVRNCKIVAKKYAKENCSPDVIIGSSAHPFNATLALKLAKKYKCKSVCEVRDLWPESIVTYGVASANNPLVKWLYKLEKKMYTKADKIIFTMAGGVQYIKDKKLDKENGGPVDLKKVYYINNGIDLEQFNHNKENFNVEDPDLDDERTFKFVYTGSLRLVNRDILLLLESAKLMKDDKYNNVKFFIYGKGDQTEQICDYIKDNEMKNVIIKDYVPKDNIPYVLSKCYVAILNCEPNEIISKYGGSQNKLFDYLASGRPIIAGENSKYSVISNNGCGISKTINTAEDLLKIFESFINMTKEEYNNLSNNCKNTAKNFDFKELTNMLLNVLEKD